MQVLLLLLVACVGFRTASAQLCSSVNFNSLSADERWLRAHNYYRCRHGHEPLQHSSSMAASAQSYADKGVFKHSTSSQRNGAGENLAAGRRSIESVVTAWYDEIKDYKRGMGFTSGVGHYTALIWKSTSKLGCGHYVGSKNSYGQMDVCRYADSTPNFRGQFEANVPQSNAPVKSESFCCTQAYGGDFDPNPDPGSGSNSNCKDFVETAHCQQWKGQYGCTSGIYAAYIRDNCKKTCNLCGGNDSATCAAYASKTLCRNAGCTWKNNRCKA